MFFYAKTPAVYIAVIPAKAGIHFYINMDPHLRGDDGDINLTQLGTLA